MDKEFVRERFSKAAGTYDDNAVVQRMMAGRLYELLAGEGGTRFGRVLEIGCGTGCLSRVFLEHCRPERMWLNDLCPEMESFVSDLLSDRTCFFAGDAEKSDLPDGLDLIMSSSVMQWFVDLPGFFRKCASSLGNMGGGGMLAFSTFGKRNLEEIQALEGTSLEYLTAGELTEMLEPMFDVLVTEENTVRLEFASPMDVLRHLKDTGVTGLKKEPWTRGRLESFCRRYAEEFPAASHSGDAVRLTYHPMFFVCRKRHSKRYGQK